VTATADRDVSRVAALRQRWTARTFLTSYASQIGITAAFIVLWLAFVTLEPDTFLSSNIYVSYGQTVAYSGLVALPLTMLITAGDIDLSFPSVMALGMVGFVEVEEATGYVEPAILAALAIGALAGLTNGVFVALIGIPALVVTIGTQFLFRGLTLVLTDGSASPLNEVVDTPAWEVLTGRLFGRIPMQFVWFVVVAVAFWFLMFRHRLGQNAHVIGDNRQAAQLMGIPVRRTRITLFVLTGVAAAFAGVLLSLQVANFYPSMGAGYLLPTLAAVFVGGTSVFGGRGTIWGTFLGAFMIGGTEAAIVAVGLTDYYTNLIYGGIILVAVTIHTVLQRRFKR
jgi:simple sugar transport system permease protein